MKIIIVGCGRVGAQLCHLLNTEGHQVTIIDLSADTLAKLGADFKGQRIKGVGFDRDVLLQAGIEHADAFAATTASDNVNILAARIAHNIFRVPRVVARVYDPRRAEIYQRLGLRTMSSTTWGAERIREMIIHAELDPLMSFGNGDVNLLAVEIPMHWTRRTVKHISVPGEISVVSITRKNQAFLPLQGTELQPGDLVHLAVLSSAVERFNGIFSI